MLRPLFAQFPAQDGDAEGKLLGYVIGLEGEPRWSIERAVRKFIRGEVEGHDGRFLPSSAELAKISRTETDYARKRADQRARFGDRKPVPRGHDFAVTDWRRKFPGLGEFKSWNLPAGAIIQARDATVHFPDGTVRTWLQCSGKSLDRRKEQAA